MLNKKCFVLDLDGTVYLGDIPIQETVDFILRHWDTIDFHFLSNNTSKAPTTYVNKLTRMGIPATLDRILSPVTQKRAPQSPSRSSCILAARG